MEHLFIPSADAAQQVHCIVWEPSGCSAPRGVLQLVHGMEEYIARYAPLATYLTSCGWAVIGHDHLGHGESGSCPRGHFTDRSDGADIVISDIAAVNALARNRWPEARIVIFGHSMGSFFVRRYLTLHPDTVSAAIICGTGWYGPLLTGSALLASRLIATLQGPRTKSRFLQTLTSPHALAFREEGRDAWLSRNTANVERYHADPLCGFGFTAGAYCAMYRNLYRLARHRDFDHLRPLPLLIISGADDPVGGSKAVERVAADYRHRGCTDVTTYAIEGDRHEILFEDDWEDTFRYLAAWLRQQE